MVHDKISLSFLTPLDSLLGYTYRRWRGRRGGDASQEPCRLSVLRRAGRVANREAVLEAVLAQGRGVVEDDIGNTGVGRDVAVHAHRNLRTGTDSKGRVRGAGILSE